MINAPTGGGMTCEHCGAELPVNAPEGLCPRCLTAMAMRLSGVETPESASSRPSGTDPHKLRYFGDYELLEEIGRGGMGVIYKARQVSLNRIVAVKMLLFGEFAGEAVVRRFRVEAEAVAGLQHPNIVAVYEVGIHQGQHYFSMEYIEGQNLDQLARGIPLTATRAARYLKTIATAIHHAHQHGVLHRDLKPSNVLIDSLNQPHVTDFGLARLVQKDSSLTRTEAILGTPSYMAPEQAAGHAKQVTTATDVFSLGALFYQMLTGRPPFQGATAIETLRQVLETEPKRPRLENPNVDADLEAICLKCLEKEPLRRYPSAEALSQDLGHWLSHEPISAAPPSAWYRLRKFARRHRLGVASTAAILMLLGAGTAVSTWQALRAKRAEKQAVIQANKSDTITRFLEEMLQGIGPSVAFGRDPAILVEILDKTAARIDQELNGQPETEVEVRTILGGVYYEVQHFDQAEAMFRQVLALRKKLRGQEHTEVADALVNVAGALQGRGRTREAEAMLKTAIAMQRKLLGNVCEDVAMSLHNLAQVLACDSRFAEAERTARESLVIMRKVHPKDHPKLANAINNLGQVLYYTGKMKESETLERDALAMYRRLYTNDTREASILAGGLADTLHKQGRLDETDALLREELAHLPPVSPERAALEVPQVAIFLHHLADVLREKKQLRKARSLALESVAMYQRHPDWFPLERAHALHVLALVAEPGDLADLEARLRETIDLTKKMLGENAPVLSDLRKDLDGVLDR